MTDWSGRRFEVEVGPVAHGGHCVARFDGRVVFVRHALPGERVEVEVTEDRGGSFCRADAVAVLAAAAGRVEPPCPVARPGGCGGCDWQHVSGAEQRALKGFVVAEQLRRLAGVDLPVEVEELAGGLLHWRSRTRLAVDALGHVGFHAHRSHRVVPVTDCPIAAPGTVDAVAGRTWTPDASVEVALDARGRTHVRELVAGPSRTVAERQIAGDGMAIEKAAHREWTLSAHAFWQVHPDAADLLAEVVGDWSAMSTGGCGWDLYSGVGLFAAVLAEQVGPQGTVVAVESLASAAEEAADNLADLPQVRVFRGKVERVLAAGSLPAPEVVVLDPPRKGAGGDVVAAIAAREPARVVYVACDPAALARDVATFASHGYRLERLRAFDTFPMTHHIECVALFVAR